MLSIFPSLLSYPLFAYALLRLVVTYGIGRVALTRWKKSHTASHRFLSVLQIIATTLIFIGLYTQIALIAGIILMKIDLYIDWRQGKATSEQIRLYFIISLIALSLLFTGPGAFAFDLPL